MLIKFTTAIIAVAVLTLAGTAAENTEKDKSKIEQGFRFGQVPSGGDDLKSKTQKQLLEELVKLSKKQLKEQKRIREILEEEYDPQPKMITMPDGTECIENSSSKCFKMPIIAEVKKIPAIAEAYKNPTLKNIKNREMWYGTYVLNVLKDSYLKGQAIRELGQKYPLATKPLGTIETTGADSVALSKYRKHIVNTNMKNFKLNIFLGKNKSLDMYSLVRLAYLIKDNPTWNFNLIFNSSKSKSTWEKQYKSFWASKYLKTANTFVQPNAFKEFKVETTPSIFLNDIKKDTNTLIFIGRATQGDIISRVIEYLIHYKYIKRNDLTATKAWQSESSEAVVETYYEHRLGLKYEK